MNSGTNILGMPSHRKYRVKSARPWSVDLENHVTTAGEKEFEWPTRISQHLDPTAAYHEKNW